MTNANQNSRLTLKGTYEIASSSTKLPTQDVFMCGKLKFGSSTIYQGSCAKFDDLCKENVDCERYHYYYDYDKGAAVKEYYDTDFLIPKGGNYSFSFSNLEIPSFEEEEESRDSRDGSRDEENQYRYKKTSQSMVSLLRYGADLEFVISMYYNANGDSRDEDEPWKKYSLVEECTVYVTTSYKDSQSQWWSWFTGNKDDDDDDDSEKVSTYYSLMAGALFLGSAASVFFCQKKRNRGTALLKDINDSDDANMAAEIEISPTPQDPSATVPRVANGRLV